MKKIKLKDIDEFVYYEKLDNGLEVYLYSKDTVHSSYVTFTTKYGSVYKVQELCIQKISVCIHSVYKLISWSKQKRV